MVALFKRTTKKEKILTSKKTKLDKIGFFNSLNLYTRLIAEKIGKGLTDVPSEPLADGKFYYGSNRIYTQKGVKKMFILHNLPPTMDRGFVSDIRDAVQNAVDTYNTTHGLSEYVHVFAVIDGTHFNLNLGNKQIQGRWSYFAAEHDRVAAKMGEQRLQDELSKDKYSDGVRRKVNSFLYIKEAKEEHEAAFYKTKVILEFVASSNDVLLDAENALEGYLYRTNLEVKEVFIQTNEYLKAYSPVRSSTQNLLRKMHEGDVWTDDIISSFSVSTHGTVGDKIGVYHGVDVQSKDILAIDFSRGSGAKNILVAAASGEGKSNYAKMLYTFYHPLSSYATIVYDYEGTEYTPLGRLTKATFVGLGVGDGRYVNTMVIGRLTGNKEIDKDLKIEAMTATERIFNVLADEDYGMTRQELSLFSDCLNEVYRDFGVTDDPQTWQNSEGCTFFHIYAKLLKMKDNPDVVREYGENAILDFIIALKPYFEQGGLRTHWFKTPISVQEILDSRNIIFNFGMGGQDEAMLDSKYLALRQMFASYITMLVTSKNKAQGLRTVIFLEELQRYLKHRFSGEIVAAISSGGRKLGIIAYYITNSPSEFMSLASKEDNADPISNNVSIVLSNITFPIIGALWRHDVDALIDYFNLDNARGVLYQLSDIKENERRDAPLKYAFFIRYRGHGAVVRMLSHPALDNLPLYETLSNAKDADQQHQEQLRMNVGDDAIRRSIDLAIEREKDLLAWKDHASISRSGYLWRKEGGKS